MSLLCLVELVSRSVKEHLDCRWFLYWQSRCVLPGSTASNSIAFNSGLWFMASHCFSEYSPIFSCLCTMPVTEMDLVSVPESSEQVNVMVSATLRHCSWHSFRDSNKALKVAYWLQSTKLSQTVAQNPMCTGMTAGCHPLHGTQKDRALRNEWRQSQNWI